MCEREKERERERDQGLREVGGRVRERELIGGISGRLCCITLFYIILFYIIPHCAPRLKIEELNRRISYRECERGRLIHKHKHGWT